MVRRGRRGRFGARNNNGFRFRSRRRRGGNPMLDGKVTTVTINPKATTLNPWNSIVLQRYVTVPDDNTFSMNVAYLRDALFSQLGISKVDVAMRLRMVEFYDFAGRPFNVSIADTSSGTNSSSTPDIVANAISYPARAGWSRARLTWPKVNFATPVHLTTTNTTGVVVIQGAVGSPVGNVTSTTDATKHKMLYKLHLLWRPLGGKLEQYNPIHLGTRSTIPFVSTDSTSKPKPSVRNITVDDEVDDEMIESFDQLDARESTCDYPVRRPGRRVG